MYERVASQPLDLFPFYLFAEIILLPIVSLVWFLPHPLYRNFYSKNDGILLYYRMKFTSKNMTLNFKGRGKIFIPFLNTQYT